MAAEKKGSKGNFLYLFDWNTKSRKKLFSNKSEELNQGKEVVDNVAISPFRLREVHANGVGSIVKGSDNYSSGSSVGGDDAYGTRAPGVVARLMGLESLPTSFSCEPNSASFHEPHSLGNHYARSGFGFQREPHILDYSCMPDKLEGFPWNSSDSRLNKGHGRPIERFQTEVLPPKSAKPISITHHKLLSPVKSPGFVPTNDAAYIMEAAARIVNSTPRPTSMIRTSSYGISSSPLRIRELKDKVDAAHRSSRLPEPYKKPQQSTSVNQIRGNPLFKSSVDSNTSSLLNVMDKGKIISRSVQETSSLHNLQRKEGSALSNNRSLLHKEPKQVTLKQSINSQQSSQKKGYIRNFANGSSGVLRQNNEKQNCISHKDRSTSKASISNQKSRKALPIDGSAGPSKIVNKVFVNSENGPKQVVSATTVSEKRPLLARLKNISRDKELVSKVTEFDKSITDLVLTNNNERDIRDLFIKTATDQRKDMNVISFTFTSPIKKYGSTSQSCHEVTKTNGHCSIDSYDLNHECNSKASLSSPSRLNFVGGDSLGFLLEQKLKEFTDGVEASHSDTIAENTSIDSTSNDPDSVSVLNFVSTTLVDKDVWLQTHDPTVDRKWKEFEGAEEHSSSSSTNKCEGRREVDLGRLKASINEGSNSHTSCLSSNSTGNEQYFLQSSQEMKGYTSSENSHKIKHEIDLSDRASSKCFEGWGTTKHSSTSQSSQEFEYVRRVLCYAGLKELLSREGSSSNIISPGIFDQLENTIFSQENNMEEEPSKIARKLLFDYVNDCFSLRHGELFLGSYKAWDKWEMYLQNKGWLAAELLEGISCLKRMGNLMLDELIEKDMSSGYGKWMGFEVEILEDGMEIGRQIEDSLVDELIVNLSLSYNFF